MDKYDQKCNEEDCPPSLNVYERDGNVTGSWRRLNVADIADIGLGYVGYFIPERHREKIDRRGEIVLSVFPVNSHDIQRDSAAVVLKNSSSVLIDICELLGNSDLLDVTVADDLGGTVVNHNYSFWYTAVRARYHIPLMKYRCTEELKQIRADRDRIDRLYFCPKMFPPPCCVGDLTGSGFDRLKGYIKRSASLGGSSVCCNGVNAQGGKKFRCANSLRRSREKGASKDVCKCPLSFTVKWDSVGYYIPLLRCCGSRYNNGCGWHSWGC
jgi:hypothetical protein